MELRSQARRSGGDLTQPRHLDEGVGPLGQFKRRPVGLVGRLSVPGSGQVLKDDRRVRARVDQVLEALRRELLRLAETTHDEAEFAGRLPEARRAARGKARIRVETYPRCPAFGQLRQRAPLVPLLWISQHDHLEAARESSRAPEKVAVVVRAAVLDEHGLVHEVGVHLVHQRLYGFKPVQPGVAVCVDDAHGYLCSPDGTNSALRSPQKPLLDGVGRTSRAWFAKNHPPPSRLGFDVLVSRRFHYEPDLLRLSATRPNEYAEDVLFGR